MAEYTPTTEELADVAEHLRLTTVLNMTEAAEVAPLWLAAHDRAVKAEAWAECSQWHAEEGMPVSGAADEHNPYRETGATE